MVTHGRRNSNALQSGRLVKTTAAMPKNPPATVANRALIKRAVEPSELVADVRTLVGAGVRIDEALLDAAMRGWSENTRRAFRSDLTLWGQWCRGRQVQPAAAGPADVAAWIRALAGTEAVSYTHLTLPTIYSV